MTAPGIGAGGRAAAGDERPQVRPVARRGADGVGMGHRSKMAGQDPVRRRQVGKVVVTHRPDDRQAMRHLGEPREMLADRDTRYVCGDRPERPANILGAPGLGSHVSSWLGPPHIKIKMHDLARPNPFGPDPCPTGFARRRPGKLSPGSASTPA